MKIGTMQRYIDCKPDIIQSLEIAEVSELYFKAIVSLHLIRNAFRGLSFVRNKKTEHFLAL